jgi:hypothetical protein
MCTFTHIYTPNINVHILNANVHIYTHLRIMHKCAPFALKCARTPSAHYPYSTTHLVHALTSRNHHLVTPETV